MTPALKRQTKFPRFVLLTAVAAVAGGVLGNLCFSLLPGQAHSPGAIVLLTALISLGGFTFSGWQLKSIAREAFDSRARVASDPADPRLGARPVLIMGLSPLSEAQQTTVRGDIERIKRGDFGPDQVGLPVRDFMVLQRVANGRAVVPAATPWQQNIRAMRFHASPRVPAERRLKKALVLPSQESTGQFVLFKEYADALFKGEVEVDFVRQSPGAPQFFCIRDANGNESRDYESYDYVRDGLERAKDQAIVGHKYRVADICIDTTPGQKPFSIAAAIMTLNTDVVFSYVTSAQPGSDRGGEVRLYDAHIDVTGLSS
jgi:hypothetical protein